MDKKDFLDTVIRMLPNMLLTPISDTSWPVELSDSTYRYYTFDQVPNLTDKFLNDLESTFEDVTSIAEKLPHPLSHEYVQERYALDWLSRFDSDIAWQKILNFLRSADYRTYENSRTAYNLIICTAASTVEIDGPNIHKIIDPIANSLTTCLRVSQDFCFLSHDELSVNISKEYPRNRLYPAFLHGFMSRLNTTRKFLVSKTQNGDIIICNKEGIIATKRHGYWKLYDGDSMTRTVNRILERFHSTKSQSGDGIIPILFDLSFKRHGALLIYDPRNNISTNIANDECYSSNTDCSEIRKRLLEPYQDFNLIAPNGPIAKPKIISELASTDGAIIFNDQSVLAFGAFISTDPRAKKEYGARSTAAKSAFYHGALPFKVSSDGDVKIYIEDSEGDQPYLYEIM